MNQYRQRMRNKKWMPISKYPKDCLGNKEDNEGRNQRNILVKVWIPNQ